MFINNISVYIFAGMCYAIIDENMPDILSIPSKKRQHYSFNCARSTWKYTFEDISKVSSYVFYIVHLWRIIFLLTLLFFWYCPLQFQRHSQRFSVYAVQWNCECFTISTNWKILSTNRILRQKKGVSCLLFVIVLHSIPLFFSSNLFERHIFSFFMLR